MNPDKFYVTTPIYYPNAKPHIGTLYSTLLADVAARWHKLLGKEVFFLTGTDEHGQKIQEAAAAKGMQPKDFVDSIVPAFKQVWELYEIEYDKFIRTTDEQHCQGVEAWIKKVMDQGDIYKSTYSGWYCVPCETFVTVGGEVVQDEKGVYLCPTHKKPLTEVAEESYFFRLSAYQDQLLQFYQDHPDFITPKERIAEVVSFVKSGLKDLSLSRKSVSWGIPFPGDPSHTVYVWADALNNYLTAVGYGKDQDLFNKWWPADMQILAKDIVRFHAVYLPAFLMAAQIPLPKKLLVHGYILMNEHKMSKSLGNACDPIQLADWYGVEPMRYYLVRQMAITHDGNFDLKDIEERIGSDLANNLGNLLSRMVALALSNNLQTVSAPSTLEASSAALREKCEDAYRFYWEEMNKGFVHLALAELMKFISEVNAYFQGQTPWVLAKQNKELFAEVIASTCHSLYAVGLMLWPIMPKKMEQMLATLGRTIDLTANNEHELRENLWNKTFTLSKLVQPLFVKPESHVEVAQEIPASAAKAAVKDEPEIAEIVIDDFAKVHLAVGTILSCQNVEGSEKLYKLEVDFGELGKRQILSGVAQYFKIEDLVGKQGVAVVNLKPRKMMGMISHGMMLFAKDAQEAMQLVSPGHNITSGSRVT